MTGPILFPDPASWAKANFSNVRLGLDRRRDRLVYSATKIAQNPGASFPETFHRRDLRCFYCLMHRPEVTHTTVIQGHCDLTKQAMNDPNEVILIVHDTTELDYTSHPALQDDLGPIGDGGGRGLLQHNSLAVRALDGLLLGLAHQQLVARQPAPANETGSQRQHRSRESRLWKEGFQGVGPAPDGCCWVDVCDRGGDVFEALHASVALRHHALIRACQDRRVLWESEGVQQSVYLMQLVRQLPEQAKGEVTVTAKGGRPGRTAQVKLAACRVWIEPPRHLVDRQNYQPIPVWVERIWEQNPPEGVEPLEWVLLSTLPIQTTEQLLLRRDWYARRWPVAEDFHQAEKTGCREEKIRFQDGQSLGSVLAVLSVVAVRLIQLRQAARACPQQPAARVATAAEIELTQQVLGVAATAWTVRDFIRGVATIGGFLGRKCDGEPGWKTLWRGYQKLQGMLDGIRIHERLQQSCVGKATAGAMGNERGPPGPQERFPQMLRLGSEHTSP